MKYPISKIVFPRDLANQTNGKVDPSLLRDVAPRAGWKMHHIAARCWAAMRAAAARDGIVLSYSGNPYRDYAGQEALFRARYTPDGPTSKDKKGRVWNGVRWYRHTGAPAAVPGTSNHGWGLAVDVALDADGDAGWEWPPKSLDRRALDWLLANAHRFGFSWELQSEPWHLRMVTGDNVPHAVLAEEGGRPQPAPATTYTVQSGDSWWGMAHRLLGSGTRYQELRDLNNNVALHPGIVIKLPAGADATIAPPPAPKPQPAPAPSRVYVVRRGDSYWRIAANHLGKGHRWNEIAALNNNKTLHPGDRIQLPPR